VAAAGCGARSQKNRPDSDATTLPRRPTGRGTSSRATDTRSLRQGQAARDWLPESRAVTSGGGASRQRSTGGDQMFAVVEHEEQSGVPGASMKVSIRPRPRRSPTPSTAATVWATRLGSESAARAIHHFLCRVEWPRGRSSQSVPRHSAAPHSREMSPRGCGSDERPHGKVDRGRVPPVRSTADALGTREQAQVAALRGRAPSRAVVRESVRLRQLP